VSKLVGCLLIVVEGFWCYAPFAFYFLGGMLLSTGWTCGVGLSPICSPAFFSVPCSSLNFQRSTGSGILNISESENHQFQFFKRIRIKELSVPVISQHLQKMWFS
jgi:hypothetical protein